MVTYMNISETRTPLKKLKNRKYTSKRSMVSTFGFSGTVPITEEELKAKTDGVIIADDIFDWNEVQHGGTATYSLQRLEAKLIKIFTIR